MSGQIIDASIVAAPKQRNTDGEKRDIKEGRIPPQWAATPAKLRQKDRDAGWTVKYSKAKPGEMARRASISQSLPTAIKTTSASTVDIA
jgi:hypothetical protein